VHGLVDGLVACAHDLCESEVADAANQQAGDCGLDELRPLRLATELRAKIAEGLREQERGEAADDSEDSVGEQLARIAQRDCRYAEHRLRAPEGAGDDHARYGGEDDGAEDRGAPLADDLFNDEEDGGDRRVEGSG